MLALILIILLPAACVFAAYGISLHRYGRYLARQHPHIWRQLGSPSLTTAQGPRRDRLAEWIGKGKYFHVSDPVVIRHGHFLRRLQRFNTVCFLASLLAALVFVLVAKLA